MHVELFTYFPYKEAETGNAKLTLEKISMEKQGVFSQPEVLNLESGSVKDDQIITDIPVSAHTVGNGKFQSFVASIIITCILHISVKFGLDA